jgi:sugar phosphate permease
VFGALGILLGLVLNRHLHEPPRGLAEGTAPSSITVAAAFRLILTTRSALFFMAAFVCANFVAVVLLTWMPKFLYERFGLSLAAAGLSATLFAQLASMAGSSLGGWLADALARRTVHGRALVQAIALFAGAPFVLLCGMTQSLAWLLLALTGWGFCKGFYDANIFASPFDVIPPQARGTVAGLMNCVGWLAGGGTAPIVIGYIAQSRGLGFAIATASGVYVLAGTLLVACMLFFLTADADRRSKPIHESR